jgi:hypothetical protein
MKILITERQFDLIMESGEGVEPYPIKSEKYFDYGYEFAFVAEFDVATNDGDILDSISMNATITVYEWWEPNVLELKKEGREILKHCAPNQEIVVLNVSFNSINQTENKKYAKLNIGKQYKTISTVVEFIKKVINLNGLVHFITFTTSGETEKERQQKDMFYQSYIKKSKYFAPIDPAIINGVFDVRWEEYMGINKDFQRCIINHLEQY